VSATGIAGPGGGTPEKPVGLVYIAIADKNGETVRKLNLVGNRDRVRMLTRKNIFWLIFENIKDKD
jgi:nicotinamide-nucleotide amidase